MSENKEMEITKMYTYNSHSDSAIIYYHITNVPSKKILMEDIKNFRQEDGNSLFSGMFRGSCHHEYDCCGCWSSDVIKLTSYDDNYNVAIVEIHFHQNV